MDSSLCQYTNQDFIVMLYSRFPGGLLHLLNNDMKNKDKNVRVPIRGGSKATCHI